MSVTLTGATGFVGRQILRNLLERGCSVRVLVRDPSRLPGVPASGALEVVQTPDLFAEATGRLAELLEGSETLVHAAWYMEPGKCLTSPLNLACLTGTLNLAHAFAAVGGKRFAGIGTCFEYDHSAGLMATDTKAVAFSSTAASVIVTPSSMVRMIVSATIDGGQTVASGTGPLCAVVSEGRNPNRHPPRPHLSSATRHLHRDNRATAALSFTNSR